MTRTTLCGAAAASLLAAIPGAGQAAADLTASPLAAFEGVWISGPGAGAPDGRPQGFGPQGPERKFRPAGPPPAPPQGPGSRGGPPEAADESEIPAALAHIDGLDRGDLAVWRLMTAEGRAAFARTDPHDLPINNCLPESLPKIAGAPGLQDWTAEDGGALTIFHEFSTATRTIASGERVAGGPHTPGGEAVWRIEGDALVIETGNLSAVAGGLARNAPGSESRSVTERYRLSPDGRTLIGEITVRDPQYLTQSVTRPVRLVRADPDTEIEIFPCSTESAQRYLN